MTASSSAAPATLTATQAAAVDDPRQVEAFSLWETGEGGERLARSRLLLGGMHCAACAGLIESALLSVPGVREADVQAASQRARVLWDPVRTRPSALIDAVQRAGYGAFPDTGAEAVARQARAARRALWELFVAAFCMMQVMMYATPSYFSTPQELGADIDALLRWASWVLSVPVVLFSAGPFLGGAWRALRRRRIGMDVPVALGIVVTFVVSSAATFDPTGVFGHEVYFDSLTMFVAFLLGARLLETRARARAALALDGVMRRLPDAVERLDGEGRAELVSPIELRLGDRVRVQAGQAFAADGTLADGRTEADESLLTGESRPVPRAPGDEVFAGCINVGAPVVMTVTRLGAQTRYQHIVALMERALTERPGFVRSLDRLAGPFLWVVLALALGAAAVWSLIDPGKAVWVAVAVLIVTCPCALSLGAPVALLAAAGELARRGVLVQRLDALEVLSRADEVVFDKTGTLTEDRLALAAVVPLSDDPPGDLLRRGGGLAARSRHPLSRALAQAAEAAAPPADAPAPDDPWSQAVVQDLPGQGLQARTAAGWWRLGAAAWAGGDGGADSATVARPAVWLAWAPDAAQPPAGGWRALARFEFDEVLRPQAPAVVRALRAAGLRVSLLSGDRRASVDTVAAHLGLDAVRAEASPQDKLEAVQVLQAAGRRVVMVGDGVNDAPVLARADVSVAMGSAAALAQARADIVVLSDRIDEVAGALDLARRTMAIVRQNLRWAVLYNLASVPLALVGWLPPWLAGMGMALSSLAVVLNALRLTRRRGFGRAAASLAPDRPAVAHGA
jgi:Cu2+-exporting ATPase